MVLVINPETVSLVYGRLRLLAKLGFLALDKCWISWGVSPMYPNAPPVSKSSCSFLSLWWACTRICCARLEKEILLLVELEREIASGSTVLVELLLEKDERFASGSTVLVELLLVVEL